jgi:peptidoglycan hydrolase-like protein with peptidoglycan-binding domain
MKKTTMSSVSTVRAFTLMAAIVAVGATTQAFAYTQLTGQLDQGQTNSNVTSLQTFFADNASIYPEGLVTGYYGGLTANAVMRFQTANGIVSSGSAATTGYGRVGPTTVSKINTLIANGGWSGSVSTSDISGPTFYNINRSQSANSATFTFTTNENTSARVVYNTVPMMFNEGDVNSNGFAAIGGYASNSYSNLSMSHSITMNNLLPNTVYYYTVIATDTMGNVSVVGPNNAFRTNAQ